MRTEPESRRAPARSERPAPTHQSGGNRDRGSITRRAGSAAGRQAQVSSNFRAASVEEFEDMVYICCVYLEASVVQRLVSMLRWVNDDRIVRTPSLPLANVVYLISKPKVSVCVSMCLSAVQIL